MGTFPICSRFAKDENVIEDSNGYKVFNIRWIHIGDTMIRITAKETKSGSIYYGGWRDYEVLATGNVTFSFNPLSADLYTFLS